MFECAGRPGCSFPPSGRRQDQWHRHGHSWSRVCRVFLAVDLDETLAAVFENKVLRWFHSSGSFLSAHACKNLMRPFDASLRLGITQLLHSDCLRPLDSLRYRLPGKHVASLLGLVTVLRGRSFLRSGWMAPFH